MLVRPFRFRAVAVSLLLLGVLTSAAPAFSGEKEDTATTNAVDKILNTDIPNANFGDAKRKLRALLDKCKRCGGPTVAHVYVAIGIVAANIGQADDAKSAWLDAFSLDASAVLPATNVTPAIRQQFDDVKKQFRTTNPSAPIADDPVKSGWVNKQAFELAKQGNASEVAGNYQDCIDKDKAALTLEENTRARLSLANCEEKSGKIVDALRDNAKALETARVKNDVVTAKVIQERITSLLPRLSHVKFERPVEVSELAITFDDRQIPEARLAESFTIDPGSHTVHAEGLLRGARVSSDDKFDVKEGETAQVKIKLKPVALTKGQLECMVTAKTQEEILACLPSDKKGLRVSTALEVSGYTDSLHVHVLSPLVRAAVSSPTDGWNIGASYLIDVVTAASPDVVASASRRFSDTRHDVAVTGGYKPGRFGAQASANFSSEHDYTSRTIGIQLLGDYMEKQVTPSIGYSFTWDTIGRAGTDFDVFHHTLDTHEVTAGSTFILNGTSLLALGGGVAFEDGDQSKPYRYIPIFFPGINPRIGASIADVNAERLPVKPLEQLPLDRKRFSITGRYIKRLTPTSTLRIEERLYRDTWQMNATTTDIRYLVDLSGRLRVWPHVHVHVQNAASFYKRVYGAQLLPDGTALVPTFRTDDRELSPMFGVTGGGGIRYSLTDPGGKIDIALYSSADALFNEYINSLYVKSRLGGYGTIGIEADFE